MNNNTIIAFPHLIDILLERGIHANFYLLSYLFQVFVLHTTHVCDFGVSCVLCRERPWPSSGSFWFLIIYVHMSFLLLKSPYNVGLPTVSSTRSPVTLNCTWIKIELIGITVFAGVVCSYMYQLKLRTEKVVLPN